jgi:hypothetical protein
MSEQIKEIRMGKGANFREVEVDQSDLLAHEFTAADGSKVSVTFRHGVVEVSTTQGRLLIQPQAANSIRVRVEKL